MSLTIEIYPREQNNNLLSKLKLKIDNLDNYSKFVKDLRFINDGNEVNDFIFDNSNSLSINQVVSPYTKSLFIDAHEIDAVFTASDIVENLFKLNGERINPEFIEDFSSVGVYYSLVSMASRSEYEINLMLLLASTLADITV